MKKGQEWTKEQLEYLIAHYPSERAEDIGEAIGKSKQAVQHKAHRLDISKDKEAFHEIRSKACSGANSGNFKGYRRKTKHGYYVRYVPDHQNASKDGLVMEHRLVIEKQLGFILPKCFDVHHINGDKGDNRVENLAIMTHKAHTILHNKQGRGQKKGNEHPLFKPVDIESVNELRKRGLSVKDACNSLGISKTNYYQKVRSA